MRIDVYMPHWRSLCRATILSVIDNCLINISNHAFLHGYLRRTNPSLLNPSLASAKQGVKLLPKPSGPFPVAINTMELIDTSRLDPFAPTKTLRRIMISAVYPVKHNSPTCRYPYMPPLTAGIEDTEYSFPAGTYESLILQVACNSKPKDDAPLVIFSPAQGNTRLDYSLLGSQGNTKGGEYTAIVRIPALFISGMHKITMLYTTIEIPNKVVNRNSIIESQR